MTNEITNEELARLKALAEAAAPGPWTWDDKVWDYDPKEQAPWLIDANESPVIMGSMKCCEADALFVASASPDTILALIAKVESLAADAERMEWLVKSDWYVGPEPWASEGGLIEEGYHNQNSSGDALRTNIDAAKAEGKA